MKVINILFLGGAKRVSFAEKLIEAGTNRNIEVKIFSYELDGQVPIAQVGEVILGLKWGDKTLIDDLLKLIDQKIIHLILPFVDQAVEIASALSYLKPNLYIPTSDIEINRKMFDKISANKWFIENGFVVPPQNITFPLIAKPRRGSASKGITVISDTEDYIYFKSKNNLDDFLLQKFITGPEYTVDCFISKEGTIISIVPRVRLEVSGGEATKTRTIKNKILIELSERIIHKAKFRGPITIQFIQDQNSSLVHIMEVNPRFGGGVLASIEAGANSPQVLIDELLDLPIKKNTDWKENLVMTRSFRETYFYANNN